MDKVYVSPEIYNELDAMTVNLRAMIQSGALPWVMEPGIRSTLATLLVAVAGMVPEPKQTHPQPTWPTGPEAA